MAKKVGYLCSVKLGTDKVVGMGTWALNGITADQLETTEFTDNWKTFDFGTKDGGTITFAGLHDPADTTGQQALMYMNLANTDVTDIRLYVDSTSYYTPCSSTGYWSPTTTSNADTILSWANITTWNVRADKAGMVEIDFSAKISGCMVLI